MTDWEFLDVFDPRTRSFDRIAFFRDPTALTFVSLGPVDRGDRFEGEGVPSTFAGAHFFEAPATKVPHGALRTEVRLDAPLRCSPCIVPKPWGREIWSTGFEARGVCEVGGVPLPWLLAAGREAFLGGSAREVILLKILDPFGVPVLGDLYTEIHAVKNEVYVCVEVDPALYPDGVGALRYGIAREALAASGNDDAVFKARYLNAVQEYEGVRRAIDAWLEEHRGELPAPVPAHEDGQEPDVRTLARWHAAAPQDLREREAALRAEMNAFTAMHPMRKGSVARVPVGVPHALQAGVRVIEFQTATYERSIVSFAQKVLTQPHWDTCAALSLLDIDQALRSPLVPQGVEVQERIVDFPGFEAWRIRIEAGGEPVVVGSDSHYELLFVVDARRYEKDAFPEQGLGEGAWLVPCGARVTLEGPCLVLRAFPRD